jgi:hypothetical protein
VLRRKRNGKHKKKIGGISEELQIFNLNSKGIEYG